MSQTTAEARARVIGECLRDFRKFCGLLKIQPKQGGGRIPLVLSPIQRAYCAARTTRDIVLKPRQVHMTTCEAARDAWWFLTKPGARVVVVCQSQTDQSALKDIAYKFVLFFDSLRALGLELPFGSENATEWTLPKTDATLRIIQAGASEASASKKGRGGTVNRLHISEAAFFERAEDTFNSLMESVPKDGSEVVNESTPNGAMGFFYEQWQAAREGTSVYRPHFFPWWVHPEYRFALEPGEEIVPRNDRERMMMAGGASPANIKWRRWKIADKGGNEKLVDQEFPSDEATCFLLSGREYFDSEVTTQLLANVKPPERTLPIRDSGALGEIRIWGLPEKGRRYIIAADTSEGTGGDDSAATIREADTGVEVAKISGQIKPGEFGVILGRIGLTYNTALIAVERNGPGLTTLDRLGNVLRYPNVFKDRDEKPGWHTNPASRPAALAGLEQGQREGTWRTLDKQTLQQMRVFVWREKTSGNVKAEAAPGEKDDLIMAEAIGWDVLRRPVKRVVRDDDVLGGV